MRFSQCDWIKHEDDRSADRKTLSPISSLSLNPDGSKLVTSGLDTKIRVWNTLPVVGPEAGKPGGPDEDPSVHKLLFTGTAHTGSVMCARFSNSGRYIASGADDRILAIWELQADSTGQPKKVWGTDEVNVETWKPVRMLSGHENDILSVAWSPDDAFLASGGVDTNVLIWDGNTFAPVRKLVFHTGFIKGLSFDPAGQYLASQSDDRSMKIYNTQDWSLSADITSCFVDAPKDSANWFLRPSWSPCGTLLSAPNAMKGPVFVASMIDRGDNWDSDTCLVGHQNIVSVAAFNPHFYVRDPNKQITDGRNVITVLALAARSSISIWNSLYAYPVLRLHDVVERDILDLCWSPDGQVLWACSSDGHVVSFDFQLSETGDKAHLTNRGTAEAFQKAKWGNFKRAKPVFNPQPVNGMAAQSAANQQPAAPPQPQRETVLPNGKKRIQPSFMGGLAQQSQPSFTQSASQSSVPVFPVSGPAPPQLPPHAPMTSTPVAARSAGFPQPLPSQGGQAAFASANAAPAQPPPSSHMQHSAFAPPPPQQLPHPYQAAPPQQMQYPYQPPMAQQHTYSHMPDTIFASSAVQRDSAPPNLDTDFGLKPTKYNRNVRGATIGGDRERDRREPLVQDIQPAFLPKAGSSKEMALAVPATLTFLEAKPSDRSDSDSEAPSNATDRLEVRNYKPDSSKEDSPHRPTEVCLISPPPSSNGSSDKGNEKTMWLDYIEHHVVAATWNGVFGAVSSIDNLLTIYSTAGRRAMPSLLLDAPCSFLDSAGQYLLAITARGRIHVWNVQSGTCAFSSTSLSPLLERVPGKQNPPTINAARVRPNGAPIISLSDGRAFTYTSEFGAWTPLTTPWWAKGSEFWEERMRSKSTSNRGILKSLEGRTNDTLVEHRYWQERLGNYDGTDGTEMVNPEGEEQSKLGHDTDWVNAMSLGHIETRLHACSILEAGSEYRQQLMLYVQRLGSENLRSKAEELIRYLMGPLYYKPGVSEKWTSTVAGLQKRDLLKEVLAQWSKGGPFKKLAGDSQDLLRRIQDPM